MNNWKITNCPVFESDLLNPKLQVSPWGGHRRFVYDLIKYMNPSNILELGTHYGCSFFAMCQSVKDNQLETELHAVDTWIGDTQAGFYENDVFEIVEKTISNCFEKLSIQLHRMTFDESREGFFDNMFDLIHIDGFHEYDAVKHDFQSFLPKLNNNGVILFHDTASSTGYGSAQFWDEVSKEYPSLQFEHSWGLGVLFPKGDVLFNQLIKDNIVEKIMYYQAQSELDLFRIKVKDLEILSLDRLESMENMEFMIKERDETIAEQQSMIDGRYATMQQMEAMIKERDEIVAEQQKMIDERYAAMQQMEEMIKERDEIVAGQQKMIDERYAAMQQMEAMIKERDEIVTEQQKIIDERYAVMQQMGEMIKERDEIVAGQQKMIDERYAAMQQMEEMIKERDEIVAGQQKMIDERYAAMQDMEDMIKERDDFISSLNK